MRKSNLFGIALAGFLLSPAAAMAAKYTGISATDGDADNITYAEGSGSTASEAEQNARDECRSSASGQACKAIAFKTGVWWAIVTCKHGNVWTTHIGADDSKRAAIAVARANGDNFAEGNDESVCPLVYSGHSSN
jgi:hypothetical protein